MFLFIERITKMTERESSDNLQRYDLERILTDEDDPNL